MIVRIESDFIDGRGGRSYDMSSRSVFGSSTRSCMRSAVVQTVTIRPARSNVTEAHSPPRSPRAVEITSGLRPSGPLSGWVSLAGPSACMLFQPFRAMNGCCATAGKSSGCASAGRPVKVGTRPAPKPCAMGVGSPPQPRAPISASATPPTADRARPITLPFEPLCRKSGRTLLSGGPRGKGSGGDDRPASGAAGRMLRRGER